MNPITSRQRVLTALQHKEPDKVPIDFGAMRSTGIMAVAYNRLKKYLGLTDGYTRLYDTGQQLAEVEKEILGLFEVDVIDLANSFGSHPEEWKPWKLPDGSPCQVPQSFNPISDGKEGYVIKDETGRTTARMPKGCVYVEGCFHPLEDAVSIDDIRKYEFHKFTDEELDSLRSRAKYLYENTDYAIMGGFGGNILETGQGVRGWSNFMMDLVGNPELADVLMDSMVKSHIENLKLYLSAVGDYIQIIQMGDDLGTQSATQLSPELYHKTIHPRHKEIYQYVKNHSKLYVFLHSCGSIYDLIPDLIDEGVDILNPVQTSAAKMDPVKLKKEFGDKLTFWGGGCDTQKALPEGSPEEVKAMTRERLKIFAPGGGYVFAQVHNVQANVPPENIVAMFDAVKKYRLYPVN